MRRLLVLLLLLPAVAQAGIKLEVQGLEEPLRNAVVQGVALSQYGDRKVTEAQVRRLYAKAPAQARKALQPYGYFDAEVDGTLKQQDGNWLVMLDVTPGEPVRVTDVSLTMEAEAASQPTVRLALASFAPAQGEVLNQGKYVSSRDAISGALTAEGYLDARLQTHRVEVYKSEHRARIELAWDAGPRYKFGKVIFSGSQFRPGLLQRYVPFEPGDWFSQDALLALQHALNGADYFAVVNVLPQFETIHDGRIDIRVELVPDKRSVYTGGPFIGSDVGFGIRLGLQRRWVNDRGHKWDNELIVAQRLKTLSSWYTIPMPGPNQRSFNLGGKFRDIDTATAHARTWELVGNETRMWHGWLRTLGVHVLAGTFTIGRNGDEPRDTPGIEHGNSTMVFGEASLMKKQADTPGFVHHGWRLTLAARSTAGELLSDTRYTQVQADAKWIHAFNPANRMIVRGTAGISSVGDFSKLPPQLRFFAGGARSVRGYGFNALGPRNAWDRVMGGPRLLVGSASFEHYFTSSWGMAAFVDAGNAFRGTDYRPRVGAGIGLRWNSPVGMIRVDLGVPVRNDHRSAVHLHLVIGPDL